MESPIKVETVEMSVATKKAPSKRGKIGRWSTAESYLFQSLLERHGKNWKSIHDHMKNRSLGQIRSHAQKFFDKVGVKKMEEYERRAKLLEAYQTLEKEKRIRDVTEIEESPLEDKSAGPVKGQEESRFTGEEDSSLLNPNNSSGIKEQKKYSQQSQQEITKEETKQSNQTMYPFLEGAQGVSCSFLVELLTRNRQLFNLHQGIEPFIDHPGFSAFTLVNRN